MGQKQVKEAQDLCNTKHSEIGESNASSSSLILSPSLIESRNVRLQSLNERRNKQGIDNLVKAAIETSKAHWSEITTPASEERDEDNNIEIFESLRRQWPSLGEQKFAWQVSGGDNLVVMQPFVQKSFWNWHYDDLVYIDTKPFAEGAQAQIYEALWIEDDEEELVLKVFKDPDRSSLRDLQMQLPTAMLGHESTRSAGYFSGGRFCNGVYGATLTKSGRFAFIMPKCWGDLRLLIDERKKHNCADSPFSDDVALRSMWQIAKGMQDLHTREIPHRDLKASNILIQKPSRYKEFDELQDDNFICKLADFECSIGIIGTGFWRAPEILRVLKAQGSSAASALFTKKSDVYSYAMTCYEVLTGYMPFEVEGYAQGNYAVVLGGERPKLPSRIPGWMHALLSRCWDMEASNRPTFEEIVAVLESNGGPFD